MLPLSPGIPVSIVIASSVYPEHNFDLVQNSFLGMNAPGFGAMHG